MKKNKGTILVTGGVGYIGSHTTVTLQQAGYEVVILDNLSNSSPNVIDGIHKITGTRPDLIIGDVRDSECLDNIFNKFNILAVMHFAGLKAVGESSQIPLTYFDNNVTGSVQLLKAMETHNVKTFIFSSSATVYGESSVLPLTEAHPLGPNNPYGDTKLAVEQLLNNLHASGSGWNITKLRYFNPIGAHDSGLIGEAPQGIPNNLMPYITKVAKSELPSLNVFGDDYGTPDGTGVRDYIHVMDLAQGHVLALSYCLNQTGINSTFNLGTGVGYSVLDIIKTFEKVTGVSVPYKVVGRRPGDLAAFWADASLSEEVLGWKATRDLESMCRDSWKWECNNN